MSYQLADISIQIGEGECHTSLASKSVSVNVIPAWQTLASKPNFLGIFLGKPSNSAEKTSQACKQCLEESYPKWGKLFFQKLIFPKKSCHLIFSHISSNWPHFSQFSSFFLSNYIKIYTKALYISSNWQNWPCLLVCWKIFVNF